MSEEESNRQEQEFIKNGRFVSSVFKFPNGMVVVFDDQNPKQQVPFLQGLYTKELFDKIRSHLGQEYEINFSHNNDINDKDFH